jgi:hydrogenase nickel incorporation protein HypA/HybF
MHELSLVASLFEVVERHVREHKDARVTRLRLKVGTMSGIVPDLLESAFDAYKKGTNAEAATLEIAIVPVKARCRACRRVFRPDPGSFNCPHCGSDRWTMLEGTDFVLDKIEIEIE